MAPHTYGEILARNLRAARSRIDIGQENVAVRMRALGYSAWIRQTVGSTERGKRRPTAEEIFALAIVLQTSITALMAPVADDKIVDLPSGATIDAASVYRSATGMNDGAIFWDGDEPAWDGDASRHRVWPPVGMSAGTGQRIEDLQNQVKTLQQQLTERDRRPRPPIVAAIVTSDRGVLVTQRRDGKPPYGFVTGEQELEEDRPEQTASRELKEETGLQDVRIGEEIGRRVHPQTGRTMIYLAATPTRGTEVHVGDLAELISVDWYGLDEALSLMPDMFGPVREYLARELAGG